MAKISFRAKAEHVQNGDTTETWVKLPKLTRSHCDMSAFRAHPKYGSYANSDLFPGMLARIRKEVFGERVWLKLHQLPDGVMVEPGFLHTISFEV